MTFIFLLIIPETIIAHGSLYLVDTDNLVWIIRNIVLPSNHMILCFFLIQVLTLGSFV